LIFVRTRASRRRMGDRKLLYSFEEYVLDSNRRELRRGTDFIPLQPQVFDLLEYLIRNRDHVVSREDLIADIWGGRIVSESALSTRINAARTAIGDNGDKQRLIRTLPRKGLRFVGAVREERKSVEETATAPAVQETRSLEPTTRPRDKAAPAERRQLTVASCELLLGAGAARMDPEDLREIVQGYQGCVAETARRYNGFVAHSVGNTGLIYFGYSQAHEYDAERAVRAGLELIAVVTALKSPVSPRARVGIASGLVVIGDLIGSGEAEEPGILGETPNLAARLQGLAAPNTVVVAESTRRLVGNLFQLENLGAKDLTGIGERVRAFAVLGSSSVESRFEALHPGQTPLVGREEELELLLRRWSRAKAGEGRVVLLSGEPGIGKSRLSAALEERLRGQPHTQLRYFCSPHHQDSALYPVIGPLQRAAGFSREDTPAVRLDKLVTLLGTPASEEEIALIADLLAVPLGARYRPVDISPQRKRELTLRALHRQLDMLMRRQPALMIFEDLHWVDPTSRELLDHIIERIEQLPILLIATYRPEFEAPWVGLPQVAVMTLNRLGRGEGAALVRCLLSDVTALPTETIDEILDRTDGVPLFVEELTKALIEAGPSQRLDALSNTPVASHTVPATLHASLLSRLDRLGASSKQVAQIGAAIGREFSYELLAAVAGLSPPVLDDALRRLVAAGLVFQRGLPPMCVYLFKHALVQDTAYSTLLRGPRQALHAKIAVALEEQVPKTGETRPEIVAHHLTEAGLYEKATSYWHRAGEQSVAKSAVLEAVGHVRKGLTLVPKLSDSAERDRNALNLQVTLGTALMAAKGFAHPEVIDAFSRARKLIMSTGNDGTELEFSILWGQWMTAFVGGDAHTALKQAEELLSIAESRAESALLTVAHRLLGSALVQNGAYQTGLSHLQRAATLFDPAVHRAHAFQFAQDIGVSVFSHLAWALWHQGYPDEAKKRAEEAIRHAKEGPAHAPNLAFAHWYASYIMLLSRRITEAEYLADVVVDIATKHRMPLWLEWGLILQGSAVAHHGHGGICAERIRNGTEAALATGAGYLEPFHLGLLAEALAAIGDIEEGLAVIDRAMARADASGQKGNYAELHRLRGDLLRRLPEPNLKECETSFRSALAIARQQGARGFELRAALSLAQFLRDQGEHYKAREVLAPSYGSFTEGFDTADLKEAKALLDALAL
jgi:DNA-binding winged helix-turn-helix (wHTH) protein/predicted ATPase